MTAAGIGRQRRRLGAQRSDVGCIGRPRGGPPGPPGPRSAGTTGSAHQRLARTNRTGINRTAWNRTRGTSGRHSGTRRTGRGSTRHGWTRRAAPPYRDAAEPRAARRAGPPNSVWPADAAGCRRSCACSRSLRGRRRGSRSRSRARAAAASEWSALRRLAAARRGVVIIGGGADARAAGGGRWPAAIAGARLRRASLACSGGSGWRGPERICPGRGAGGADRAGITGPRFARSTRAARAVRSPAADATETRDAPARCASAVLSRSGGCGPARLPARAGGGAALRNGGAALRNATRPAARAGSCCGAAS